MRTALYREVIKEICDICGETFILEKTGFNLLSNHTPYNDDKAQSEIWICNKCYINYLSYYDALEYYKTHKKILLSRLSVFDPRIVGMVRCRHCGERFHPADNRVKFCSEKCKKDYRREYKRKHEAESYNKKILASRQATNRFCLRCGKPLPLRYHGNRKYHDECI